MKKIIVNLPYKRCMELKIDLDYLYQGTALFNHIHEDLEKLDGMKMSDLSFIQAVSRFYESKSLSISWRFYGIWGEIYIDGYESGFVATFSTLKIELNIDYNLLIGDN